MATCETRQRKKGRTGRPLDALRCTAWHDPTLPGEAMLDAATKAHCVAASKPLDQSFSFISLVSSPLLGATSVMSDSNISSSLDLLPLIHAGRLHQAFPPLVSA